VSKNRPAYTLLELTISLALLILLIGLLWGMIDMFGGTFTRGELRAEQSQLVRSLSQILEEDLGAAIQDPVYPFRDDSRGAETIRRFGLVGTDSSIRIDVVQINPFKTKDFADSKSVEAPELKTVHYDFISSGRSGQPGLFRREMDFETPSGNTSEMKPGESLKLAGSSGPPTLGELPTLGESGQNRQNIMVPEQISLQDHEKMWAPEVVGCRFAYFDGQNWLNHWDSIKQNGLPAAIEVNLRLLTLQEAKKYHSGEEINGRNVMDQRIVVRVPTTPLKKQSELKRDQPVSPDQQQPPPFPPVSSPRPQPVPSIPAQPSQEQTWIRQ